ncbi:sec-independent protein translocase protein TATB, chloroplastic-like isoform X2 [Phragmites australis]|uniref:sec-independent protein translocase protein TATB, chloroplastic-like isoform X2 n=1 Tax=Phragmites australis TaxID=29695 RepID=UPI002D793DF6|nr:sec-independent protein translocase protein TATB, chloroplastic-like isoform X2 [Phragmites australis]
MSPPARAHTPSFCPCSTFFPNSRRPAPPLLLQPGLGMLGWRLTGRGVVGVSSAAGSYGGRPNPPQGKRRPWAWGSVRTRMISSFVGSRRASRRSVICASLFGVGAPEALVIGVVALLVFGPKGLAEIARNLGKTLRAFQPTIRELQDVSREFRSTLEREIGIDEVPPSTNYRPTNMNNSQQPAADPNVKPETAPYTSEELMKVTEEQIAASAAAAWNAQQPAPSQQQEAASTVQSTDTATSGGTDNPAAAVTESDPSQANQSEKVETER